MPSKTDAAKAAATKAAVSAAPTVLPFVVAGVAALVLWKALPKIGDLAGDAAKAAAGAAAEGTGDFFKGVFTGAEDKDVEITVASISGKTYSLTPGTVLGTFETWDRNQPTSYKIIYDEGGLPVVQITNPSAILPPPTFYTIEQAPLAQEFGAAVIYDPVTGLYTDPFFGSLGGPSVQDAVGATIEGTTGLYTDPFFGSLGGPSIQDALEGTKNLFRSIF